jgi:hypothetical protein
VLSVKIPRTQIVQDQAERQLESQEIKQPSILLAGSAMAVIRIAVGTTVFLSAFSFKDDKIALGVVLGSYAIGSFVGNLIAPIARRHVREEVMLVTCLLGSSVFVLLGALTGGGVGGAAFAAIAVATASAAGRVGFDSLLQRDGPDAVRGRAFARFETRFQVAWVIGALFGLIPFSEGVGLLVLGLVLLAAGLSYLGALRSARTRPQRSTLRPEAVDRAFDKARGELRERYGRSKRGRRRAAEENRKREDKPRSSSPRGAASDAPTQPPPAEPVRPPPPPQRRRRRSSAKATGDPPDAFPGGS